MPKDNPVDNRTDNRILDAFFEALKIVGRVSFCIREKKIPRNFCMPYHNLTFKSQFLIY